MSLIPTNIDYRNGPIVLTGGRDTTDVLPDLQVMGGVTCAKNVDVTGTLDAGSLSATGNCTVQGYLNGAESLITGNCTVQGTFTNGVYPSGLCCSFYNNSVTGWYDETWWVPVLTKVDYLTGDKIKTLYRNRAIAESHISQFGHNIWNQIAKGKNEGTIVTIRTPDHSQVFLSTYTIATQTITYLSLSGFTTFFNAFEDHAIVYDASSDKYIVGGTTAANQLTLIKVDPTTGVCTSFSTTPQSINDYITDICIIDTSIFTFYNRNSSGLRINYLEWSLTTGDFIAQNFYDMDIYTPNFLGTEQINLLYANDRRVFWGCTVDPVNFRFHVIVGAYRSIGGLCQRTLGYVEGTSLSDLKNEISGNAFTLNVCEFLPSTIYNGMAYL